MPLTLPPFKLFFFFFTHSSGLFAEALGGNPGRRPGAPGRDKREFPSGDLLRAAVPFFESQAQLCSEGGGDTLQSPGMKLRSHLQVLICVSPLKDLWQTHLFASQLRYKATFIGWPGEFTV